MVAAAGLCHRPAGLRRQSSRGSPAYARQKWFKHFTDYTDNNAIEAPYGASLADSAAPDARPILVRLPELAFSYLYHLGLGLRLELFNC